MSTRIDGASCQIIPDDLYTSGEPRLNRLANAAGDRFDVWQRQINRIANGFWSARNTVLSIPRQTGKTYDIGWVAIHRAARTPGMRIVWTAQHFSVIKDTLESLCRDRAQAGDERPRGPRPRHPSPPAKGERFTRSRIFFRAPAHCEASRRSPCSPSDSAAMLPTQNRAYNPRPSTWAPRPAQGTTAKRSPASGTKRARAAPTAPSTANPSYPAHTSDESIANLWENLTGDDFRREALGIWDEHALSA